ncbi:sensitivity to red light reduced protein (SRR1) [Wolffia australiana]
MPDDDDDDPARVARILQKLDSALSRLRASTFFRRFLSQLRDDPTVSTSLAKIAPPPEKIQIVLYGVGSIEAYEPPRLQISLAILLRRAMGESAGEIEVFDPILSAAECSAMEALGCRVSKVNDRGRRIVDRPMLFYMPHCEAALYDNLLEVNLGRILSMGRMAVLGNSFSEYGRFAEEGLKGSGSDREKARAFNETSWHFFRLDGFETAKNCATEVG